MKIAPVIRDAILLALAFLSLQTLQALLLKDALLRQERAAAHRLCAGVGGVLNKAHRAKDDLLFYQILGALQKAPGVVEARVDDLEVKAHAQPGSYTFALRDGGLKWGSLVLSLSDRPFRRLERRFSLAGIAAGSLLWTALFIYRQRLERRAAHLRLQVVEFQGMLDEEKRKRKDAEKREQLCALQSSAWLEVALSYMSRPLLLLDGRQRLAAANAAAAALLGARDPRDLSGKSWQDVRELSACGPSLAESLGSPGRPVHKMDGASGRVVEFFTMNSTGSLSGGTWVRFRDEA